MYIKLAGFPWDRFYGEATSAQKKQKSTHYPLSLLSHHQKLGPFGKSPFNTCSASYVWTSLFLPGTSNGWFCWPPILCYLQLLIDLLGSPHSGPKSLKCFHSKCQTQLFLQGLPSLPSAGPAGAVSLLVPLPLQFLPRTPFLDLGTPQAPLPGKAEGDAGLLSCPNPPFSTLPPVKWKKMLLNH